MVPEATRDHTGGAIGADSGGPSRRTCGAGSCARRAPPRSAQGSGRWVGGEVPGARRRSLRVGVGSGSDRCFRQHNSAKTAAGSDICCRKPREAYRVYEDAPRVGRERRVRPARDTNSYTRNAPADPGPRRARKPRHPLTVRSPEPTDGGARGADDPTPAPSVASRRCSRIGESRPQQARRLSCSCRSSRSPVFRGRCSSPTAPRPPPAA